MLVLLAPFALLVHAHAHNDYAHPRPLLDALDQGFLSVEADIFLVDGELRVGHSREELKPGRTLESLYLDPLAERVKHHGGTVYETPGTLSLMIDLKEPGARLEPELIAHLARYRGMLTDRVGTTVRRRAVQIVLSGARTPECAASDGVLFKDGGIGDLSDSPARTPWISGSYPELLGSKESPLPNEAKARLDALVARAHASGKRLRLWEAPDTVATWTELRRADVDLINTDRLAELRAFFIRR